MGQDAREAYEELIRGHASSGCWPRARRSWAGTSRPTCPRGAPRIGASRWPCWPGCTTSGPPIPGSASCWRGSRAPTWSRTRDSPAAANIREIRRATTAATKLPRSLVEELARTTSLAQQEWIAARQDADFRRFRPWLEKIVGLKRQEAACLSRLPSPRPREPAGQLALRRPARRVRAGGPERASCACCSRRCESELSRWSSDRRGVAPGGHRIPGGADPAADVSARPAAGLRRGGGGRGRASTSSAAGSTSRRHPFCTGIGPGDCRITTRYDAHEFSDAFFGVLHEVGHGLYEQGLARRALRHADGRGGLAGRPRVAVAALGERRGPGPAVLDLLVPAGPAGLPRGPARRHARRTSWSPSTTSSPSLIRVQADEVTYNLHILDPVRARAGAPHRRPGPSATCPPPGTRSTGESLGVTPPNDAEGCLQDIHWSAGLFGYFPTYTLGNLYAAQLFSRARAELAGLDDAFARGEFAELLGLAPRQRPSPRPAVQPRHPHRARDGHSTGPPAPPRVASPQVQHSVRGLSATGRLARAAPSPTRSRSEAAHFPGARHSPRLFLPERLHKFSVIDNVSRGGRSITHV